MASILTFLETSGSYATLPKTATAEERLALSNWLTAMRKQGHALNADEVMEHGEPSGAIRVLHYRSCAECARNGRAF